MTEISTLLRAAIAAWVSYSAASISRRYLPNRSSSHPRVETGDAVNLRQSFRCLSPARSGTVGTAPCQIAAGSCRGGGAGPASGNAPPMTTASCVRASCIRSRAISSSGLIEWRGRSSEFSSGSLSDFHHLAASMTGWFWSLVYPPRCGEIHPAFSCQADDNRGRPRSRPGKSKPLRQSTIARLHCRSMRLLFLRGRIGGTFSGFMDFDRFAFGNLAADIQRQPCRLR